MTVHEFNRLWDRVWRIDLPRNYRIVAQAVIADNPAVADEAKAREVVAAVARVPLDKIGKVTLRMLLNEYGCPPVFVLAEPKHRLGVEDTGDPTSEFDD